MFCPRCGRAVNETANFCGGCGMPKAEILKHYQQTVAPEVTPVPETTPADELNDTITQLENQLINDNSPLVTDYTTEVTRDTNTNEDVFTPSDFIRQEIKAEQQERVYAQPQYSYSAPEYPVYQMPETTVETAVKETDHTLSTVDFIWMMIIAGIPVVGMVYLLYNAFASANPNKRSYSRAVLIISLFGCLIATVFGVGLLISQLAFFY